MGMNGIVDDPDDRAMRQIPSRQLPWTYALWVNEVGVVRPRFYDVITNDWVWGDVRLPIPDSRGRMGFYVYGTFRTITQAIALAWLPRYTPARRMRGICLAEGDEVVAHNMLWKDETECDSEERHLRREWLALRFKFGVIRCDFPGHKVSRCGCLKTGRVVVDGTYAVGPFKFGLLPRLGVVNLEEVVRLLDNKRRHPPPPRFARVMRRLRTGLSIREISQSEGVRESTAWAYAYEAMRHMSTTTARRVTLQCLSPNVAAAMGQLLIEAPAIVLTGRIRELVYSLTQMLAADPGWKSNPQRYAEARMLRALHQREYDR